jgi:hypothetical protein
MPHSKSVERRVPGGKTFRLTVFFHAGKVERISLTGDFFIVPEEGLEVVERVLLHLAVRGNAPDSTEGLQHALDSRGIRLVGLSSLELVDALGEAMS